MICGEMWQPQLRNCQNHPSLDTYCQFISETIGVELTTPPSCMQNFVKKARGNCVHNRLGTDEIDIKVAFAPL